MLGTSAERKFQRGYFLLVLFFRGGSSRWEERAEIPAGLVLFFRGGSSGVNNFFFKMELFLINSHY